MDASAKIPDLPEGKGFRHPLSAILCFIALAVLSGCKSSTVIAPFGHDQRAALARLSAGRCQKTNEHMGTLALLGILPVKWCILTGDAAFRQDAIGEKIVDGRGDDGLFVKDTPSILAIDTTAGLSIDEPNNSKQFLPLRGNDSRGGHRDHPHGPGSRADRKVDHSLASSSDKTANRYTISRL